MEPRYIGGQAVMEGVMMRNGNRVSIAVRKPDGQIEIETEERVSLSQTYPVLGLPLVRGAVVLVESTVLGMQALTRSANMSTGEDEEELTGWQLTLTLLASFVLAVFLFVLAPVYAAKWLSDSGVSFAAAEGAVRLAVFVGYIGLISRMKEIRRVFEYHGAEHKTINCYEAGDPLTVDNVRRHTLLHKRCGTSFLLFVVLISIFLFSFFSGEQLSMSAKVGIRIALLPVIAGLAYELIRWSARQSSQWSLWFIAPGLMMQKLTTREPDDSQIEVAIASVLAVLSPEQPVVCVKESFELVEAANEGT
ncbi:DUF1385 domain-containing protein [Effusibacillus lacus]|uniref:DUF1385 domain-containing protein n=1 Tax=Effusibacillus lacus TaxID=1348429 RepID=A0A292YMR5_9BACL|nr:DUF1385 domain-containing protein [Effusibacillus lacus]TCS68259.1 uncharacterized protein YqhQ [Effusibacillus lacus]GAX90189.1 hypothetical protein EFBL_1815 [Effusibacillus lacus]